MTDDIVTRLREQVELAKPSFPQIYLVEAADEIERLRKLIKDYVSLWGQVETGRFADGTYDPENVVKAYYAKFHEMKEAVRGD